ncbi:hypothetical protein DASC09_009690 [Saccharomycopsis crataegensis]|uniref:Uncharacterized protein n=1 Tax=Saccharomycopsis crataegensis TaxID=43959 RepID=A0AAV5QH09_9ASCO|nr:hypothetical protein DASC09_009690 [Saccharomycopsis crataegensis]
MRRFQEELEDIVDTGRELFSMIEMVLDFEEFDQILQYCDAPIRRTALENRRQAEGDLSDDYMDYVKASFDFDL